MSRIEVRRVLAGAGDHPSAGKWKVESRDFVERVKRVWTRRGFVWASVGVEGFRKADGQGGESEAEAGGWRGVDRMKGVRAGGGGGLEEARKIRG